MLADALARCWGIEATFSDLPSTPEWLINTTCYETGRNWSFSKREMGDYVVGYFENPQLSLRTALAASAAVPAAIGPLKLELPTVLPRQLPYRKPPGEENLVHRKFVTLWDGGIYENLGVEKLFRVAEFASPIDFLVTSDASAPLSVRIGSWSRKLPFYVRMHRLIDVATEQGRSYRVRSLMNFLIKNPGRGAFIKIGNTPRYVFGQAQKDLPADYPPDLDSVVKRVWLMDTSLRKLKADEFADLRLHGYWTAKATFDAWVSPGSASSAQ
jgi:NTE family protein